MVQSSTSGSKPEMLGRTHHHLEHLVAEWEVVVPEIGKYRKTHGEMLGMLRFLGNHRLK